ncbi:MAG: site-specific integrase [Methylocystaceae bacterium]|nr:site-specific integrase [Methylocystaceae bacterium]
MREGKAAVLTEQQLTRLFKILKTERHAIRNLAICYMSFGLGLRVGEIATLRVHDVLDTSGELRDHFQITRANSKTNTNREVFLTNPRVRRSVSRYIEQRQSEEGVAFNTNSFLFRSQKASAFTPNTMQQMIKRLFRRAGLPESASSHSGRRGFATSLIARGIDLKSVSVLMGHATVNQTAAYAESNPHVLKNVAATAF